MLNARAFGPLNRRRPDRLPANGRPSIWQRRVSAVEPLPSAPDVRDSRLARLEAVLFATEEPLSARRLASLAELTDVAETRRLIERLRGFARGRRSRRFASKISPAAFNC